MEIRNKTNSLIVINESQKAWLRCLRQMLLELEDFDNDNVKLIFKKYNVYFVETDDLPRVNLDFPTFT